MDIDPPSPRSGTRTRAKEYVHASMEKAHAAFHVPSAIEIDGWLYLTGVIAAPMPDENQLEPAFERAFRQIGEVLESAASNWGDVVKITSYHIDISSEIQAMARVKDKYVSAPYPAWSVLGVASLASPSGICEIEVIARKA